MEVIFSETSKPWDHLNQKKAQHKITSWDHLRQKRAQHKITSW